MNGNNWLQRNKLAEINFIPESTLKKTEGRYIDMGNDRGAMALPGSIFEVRLDLTHPVCYGFTRSLMPVFKSGTSSAKKVSSIYNNPAVYTDKPLLSGYCTQDNLDRIKGSAFVSIHGTRVISIYDNTNFRAIWFGTNKMFMNAVFFGQIIR